MQSGQASRLLTAPEMQDAVGRNWVLLIEGIILLCDWVSYVAGTARGRRSQALSI